MSQDLLNYFAVDAETVQAAAQAAPGSMVATSFGDAGVTLVARAVFDFQMGPFAESTMCSDEHRQYQFLRVV